MLVAYDGQSICLTRLDNHGNVTSLIIQLPYKWFCLELRAWNRGDIHAFKDHPHLRRWLMNDL